MEIKMIDLFLGRTPEVEEQDIKPIGRNAARGQYEKTFHDELDRQDREMYRTEHPSYGIDPRRRQEMADGGMVREDQRAMSNLSPKAIHHEYPKLPFYSTPYNDALVKSKSSYAKATADKSRRK